MINVLRATSMDKREQMEETEEYQEEDEIFAQRTKWETFWGFVLDVILICLFPISAWWCIKTVQVLMSRWFISYSYSTLKAPSLKVIFI